MKAIVISRPGPPSVLELAERPVPTVTAADVLIQVKAAGVNRADIAQREGRYPAPPEVPADIPGLEVAGIVVQCGSAVTRWKPGDSVCALLAGGGYAEFVAVNGKHCLPVPPTWTFQPKFRS
ncbi:MAG: alcohol dehydrogenase catalytic domain-containing protein [Opitutus sp.]